MAVFNEDSMYRMSSQYRLWSFSYGALVAERDIANHTPAEHVRKKRKTSHNGVTPSKRRASEIDLPTTNEDDSPVQSLAPHQELHILNHTLVPHLIQICRTYFAHMAVNDKVRGTAAQYLRRYYLKHSLMEPVAFSARDQAASLDSATLMLLACIYLAMKVHDEYMGLSDFVHRIQDKGARESLKGAGEVTVEGMKNAEAQLTRTLRFCFDVRHASAGLRGLELDLTLLACGKGDAKIVELSQQLRKLSTTGGSPETAENGHAQIDDETRPLRDRIGVALNAAAVTLKTTVHTSDVYFLYTPSQILFAALYLADAELAHWYLGTKLPSAIDAPNGAQNGNSDASHEEKAQKAFELHSKVIATVRGCAERLIEARDSELPRLELEALEARLAACQRLMSESGHDDADGSKSVKRNGIDAGFSSSDEGGDIVDGKKRKRRKVEDDDVFGAPL